MVESKRYDLDLVFRALGDPTRRAMLKSLSRKERTITELAMPFDISLAAASKHVRTLERARLIRRRREGSFSYLSIDGGAMMLAEDWMRSFRSFWPSSSGGDGIVEF